MNLGQAVAVCLYEIVRSGAAVRAKPDVKRAARAEDLERMTEKLEDVLAALRLRARAHGGFDAHEDPPTHSPHGPECARRRSVAGDAPAVAMETQVHGWYAAH
jgi:hypothetical protein